MGVDIYVHYEGGLRCTTTHGPSGASFQTDAPVDNHGRGEAFSPTDLLATSLASCMLTTMGILAQKRGWNIEGLDAHVIKEMSKEPPRKVSSLPSTITAPATIGAALDKQARDELEHAAHNCPVRLSIHPAIEVPLTFRWGL